MKKHINYRGFWSMLALMFGFTIFSASVMTGATIGDSIATWKGALAIVFGNAILAIYGGVLAYVSSKRRKNLDGTLKRAFGKFGASIPSFVMVITQLGWFGVGIAMIASPLAERAGISEWIFVFIIGALIISTAFFGIKSLTIISIIAVPLVLLLGIVTVGLSIAHGTPKSPHSNTMGFLAATSMVIGTFISGATFVPNFAVNAKGPKTAVVTTAAAFFVGNGLMILFGFISKLYLEGSIFGFVSITESIAKLIPGGNVLIGIGIVILILNIWTTNDSGLYSISLGLSHWVKRPSKVNGKIVWNKIPKRAFVLVFGLIGAAMAQYLFANFIEFLNYMNRFVPPIGALIIFNHFFRKKESRFMYKGFNIGAIFILALASGITFIPALTPYAPLISFGIVAITYLPYIIIEERYFPKEKKIREDKKDELENEIITKKSTLSK